MKFAWKSTTATGQKIIRLEGIVDTRTLLDTLSVGHTAMADFHSQVPSREEVEGKNPIELMGAAGEKQARFERIIIRTRQPVLVRVGVV